MALDGIKRKKKTLRISKRFCMLVPTARFELAQPTATTPSR